MANLKVAIVGAGISGLTVANGLLNSPTGKFDVQVYERDSIAFSSERGGYQIRIANNGLRGLKTAADAALWTRLREVWDGNTSRAPSLVEPANFKIALDLSRYKAYPSSRPVSRMALRKALLHRPLEENRVHFGHLFEYFEQTEPDGSFVLYFDKGQTATADLIIAADGSNSRINRQVGLRNKVKLQDWTLIQSRGLVDASTRNKLPLSLLSNGAVLFLGGRKATGFASIFGPHLDESSAGDKYNLFWSTLIPHATGESIIAKASGDEDVLLELMGDYFCRDLGYGNSLPSIMHAGKEHLRTGLLTSSVRPQAGWREKNSVSPRVILLGDAIHPMTPGRGQGANQALTDAGQLITLLHNARLTGNAATITSELAGIVQSFEREMFPRAFDMVKQSEAVTDLDLTTTKGKLIINVVGALMTVIGWGFSIMETVGLKKPESMDFGALPS